MAKRKTPIKESDEFNPNIKTNKWGANQHRSDPRQKLCWEFYVNPKSKTFGNAKQSAIRAGYSPKSAGLVTQENWFIHKYKSLDRVSKSEQVLDMILNMDPKKVIVKDIKDEDGNVIDTVVYEGGIDVQLLREQKGTAMFCLERLAKRKYSLRSEVTGKGGEPIKYSLSEDEQQRITKAIRGITSNIGKSSNKD